METKLSKRNWVLSLAGVFLICAALVPAFVWWSEKKTEEIAFSCRAAIRSENWVEAQKLADMWVRRKPEDGDGWLSLADIAKANGDLAATAECLACVPATDGRFLKSQMLRGDLILDGLGRPHDAVRVWKEMLLASPDVEVAHQRLLYVYSMTLQRQKLVDQIHQAIKNKAEPPEAYGYILSMPNLMFSDGYLRVGKWLESTPDDETLQVAFSIFAAKINPSRGLKMFGVKGVRPGHDDGVFDLLKKYPQNLELKAYAIEKAIAADDMGALAAALRDLPKEAESDCRFWRFIGTLQDFQRQPAEAAKSFKQSIQLHPMEWKSHHSLATVERVLGDAELAAKHADLGSRGKELERKILELPNAAQVDSAILEDLLKYARDCGDQTVVDGLTFRLK